MTWSALGPGAGGLHELPGSALPWEPLGNMLQEPPGQCKMCQGPRQEGTNVRVKCSVTSARSWSAPTGKAVHLHLGSELPAPAGEQPLPAGAETPEGISFENLSAAFHRLFLRAPQWWHVQHHGSLAGAAVPSTGILYRASPGTPGSWDVSSRDHWKESRERECPKTPAPSCSIPPSGATSSAHPGRLARDAQRAQRLTMLHRANGERGCWSGMGLPSRSWAVVTSFGTPPVNRWEQNYVGSTERMQILSPAQRDDCSK